MEGRHLMLLILPTQQSIPAELAAPSRQKADAEARAAARW